MKPVLLIAANFLREHRWPVLLMFGWIALIAFASADFNRGRPVADDVWFFVVHQAIYICVFSAFLAADAIHTDRKSRRILLVLSKAVTRANYLLAPTVGTCGIAVGYALVYGVCGVWLTARAILPDSGVWSMVLLVIAGSALAATGALFFSTFLNPYASIAAVVLLFVGPVAIHAQRHPWSFWLPGFPLLIQAVNFRFDSEWRVSWTLVLLALMQSVIFWLLAVAIFRRKDIAVPVE